MTGRNSIFPPTPKIRLKIIISFLTPKCDESTITTDNHHMVQISHILISTSQTTAVFVKIVDVGTHRTNTVVTLHQ